MWMNFFFLQTMTPINRMTHLQIYLNKTWVIHTKNSDRPAMISRIGMYVWINGMGEWKKGRIDLNERNGRYDRISKN